MSNLLFIASVILLTGWLIGFFGYDAGGAFHLLLIIALIAILISLLGGKKTL